MVDQETEFDENSVRVPRRRLRCLFVTFFAALAGLTAWCATHPGFWESLEWRSISPAWFVQIGWRLGSRVVRDLLPFLVLSFLAGASVAPMWRNSSYIKTLFAGLVGAFVSFVVAIGLRSLVYGLPPALPWFVVVIYTALACLWGSWLGATWLRSGSTIGWFFRQSLLLVIVIAVGSIAFLWFSLSPAPLDVRSATLETEDRRRLVGLFQEHDPQDLQEGETTTLTLTELDINQLASWGLSILPGEHHGRAELSDGRIAVQMSSRMPPIPILPGNLNLIAAGRVMTQDREVAVVPMAIQVGRISVPSWLLEHSGPIVFDEVWYNDTTAPFLSALEDIEIRESGVTIAYGPLDVKAGFVNDALVGLGVMEDLAPSTAAHAERLIDLVERNPDVTFTDCVEAVFEEAQKRSQDGSAVQENQAAILAMGYLMGHSVIRKLIGKSLPNPPTEVRARLGKIPLRGRHDWRQHFTVSASLKVLGNAAASMDVGLLKEELDADGGSGFSFGDLLADRSGTMLAVRATESEQAAVAMQQRVTKGLRETDLIPVVDNLPEGLTDAEFQKRFGGVGGDAYQEKLAEIDRRIARCAAYAK